jgi:hypothetical protein
MSIKKGEKRRVVLLGDVLDIDVHWLEDQRTSRPCTGDGCPWCEAPRRVAYFAAAILEGKTMAPQELPKETDWDKLSEAAREPIKAEVARRNPGVSPESSRFLSACVEEARRRHGKPIDQAKASPVFVLSKTRVVLELGADVVRELGERDLHGLVIVIDRTGAKRTVNVVGQMPADELPQPFSILDVLCRSWGIEPEAAGPTEPEAHPGIVPLRSRRAAGGA